MSEDYKKRIRDIVMDGVAKENERLLKESQPKTKRTNAKPEEEVVKAILEAAPFWNFSLKRYESKAKLIGGRWRSSGLDFGTPDVMGVSPHGFYIACEVKAPGKRTSLRPNQRTFLTDIISHGGFGIVCTSATELKETYDEWFKMGTHLRAEYLMKLLPTINKKSQEPVAPF